MTEKHISRIAQELKVRPEQVRTTAELLADECTVPFIARYRKEATGGLDEVAIAAIRDRLAQLAEMDKRRQTILKTIEEQGKLTDELREKIEEAETPARLEDLYLPYRPKRRTRATVARERGLEPLATRVFEQGEVDPDLEAAKYVDAEKGVEKAEAALAGARDIIAEWISEDQEARTRLRRLFRQKATFRSAVAPGKEEAGAKYRDYFDWNEPASKAPSHRVLAMRRGEKEGFLAVRVLPEEDEAVAVLEPLFVRGENAASAQVREAVRDGYKRLLSLSMETEMRVETKKRADEEAIRIFADNLRQLLLAPPLGRKRVVAVDPGLRTGCKVTCLDAQGKLLHHEAIYPHAPRNETEQAGETIRELCRKFEIEAVAVGNGTAGRETESFVRGLAIPDVLVVMVDESGASVYSASKAARAEFPKEDITVRGSVSIGRRLMDPLAELVKIDPKSIGVGQYQHDVDQPALRRSLRDVVSSCVNAVGVELNTASRELLTYVSGLGPSLAQGIVAYRDEHGPFASREALTSVPRLGPKAFEQAAGFLRVRDSANPLDASAVHPESYPVVEAMARSVERGLADLMRDSALRERVDLSSFVTDTVGMPTLTDIMAELAKPGRDPRQQFQAFQFQEGVEKLEDLEPGMRLPGIVTNITAFGCFVDIGVHQDGLVHISELANHYVKDPAAVVKLRQQVTVTVLTIDLDRKRISLSLRSPEERKEPRRRPKTPAGEGEAPRKRPEREGGTPRKRPEGESRAPRKPPEKRRAAPRPPREPVRSKVRPKGKSGPKPGGDEKKRDPADIPQTGSGHNNPIADYFRQNPPDA